MEREYVVIGLIVGLLLLVQALVSVPIVSYYSKGVAYEFNAEVRQCESALENYNDKSPDFINYERTNTDNLAIDSRAQLQECRKVTSQPEYYLKSRYIGFWIGVIVTEFFVAVFIILLGILLGLLGLLGLMLSETKESDPNPWY